MSLSSGTLWPGNGPIWMLGCGNMGGALLSRWLNAGLDPARVTVIDPAPRRIEAINWVAVPPDEKPDLLILGVKPQTISAAAGSIADHVDGHTLVLSMLAGTEVDSLSGYFPKAQTIVRCMPNLPVALGKGVTALYSPDGHNAAIDALFAPTGHFEWLDEEQLFHAVVSLSGSGPAFVYRFIEALSAAGETLGLPPAQALNLARATVEGAAALSRGSDEAPADLVRKVASPGGTTAAGLAVLDEGGVLRERIAATLQAAARRSAELARPD